MQVPLQAQSKIAAQHSLGSGRFGVEWMQIYNSLVLLIFMAYAKKSPNIVVDVLQAVVQKHVVHYTPGKLANISRMEVLGPIQKIVLVILVLLCINYIALVCFDKVTPYLTTTTEGFSGEKDSKLYTWTTETQSIYDDFLRRSL